MIFTKEEWGQNLPSHDERSIHLREVLRVQAGDQLKVGLLGAGYATALVKRCDRTGTELSFPAPEQLSTLAAVVPVRLILAHPRPPVMQRLLKDINALDIQKIDIVLGQLAEKSYFESKIWKNKHYESFLLQGACQGGVPRLSQLTRHWSLQAALTSMPGTLSDASHKIVFDLGSKLPSFLDLCHQIAHSAGFSEFSQQPEIVVAVGCERGWSYQERAIFGQAGFTSYSLGSSILRTEAAVNLALGMLCLALTTATSKQRQAE